MWCSLWFGTAAAGPSAVDRVPEEFPTLQDAVDHGTAPTIRLAAGTWAGATLTRPVAVVSRSAVIDRGVPVGEGVTAAVVVPAAASGSRIEGLTIDCRGAGLDLGVFGSAARLGSVASDVEIAGNRFVQCVQAVTDAGLPSPRCDSEEVTGGSGWSVHDNAVDGLASGFDGGRPGGGVGILFFNALAADVWGNTFGGVVADQPRYATSAIGLAGCIDCTVTENTFALAGGRFWYTAVNNAGAALPGAVASRNLMLAWNDAGDDSAPWLGVSFLSRDSAATEAVDNVGVVYVDHERCGDGALHGG